MIIWRSQTFCRIRPAGLVLASAWALLNGGCVSGEQEAPKDPGTWIEPSEHTDNPEFLLLGKDSRYMVYLPGPRSLWQGSFVARIKALKGEEDVAGLVSRDRARVQAADYVIVSEDSDVETLLPAKDRPRRLGFSATIKRKWPGQAQAEPLVKGVSVTVRDVLLSRNEPPGPDQQHSLYIFGNEQNLFAYSPHSRIHRHVFKVQVPHGVLSRSEAAILHQGYYVDLVNAPDELAQGQNVQAAFGPENKRRIGIKILDQLN